MIDNSIIRSIAMFRTHNKSLNLTIDKEVYCSSLLSTGDRFKDPHGYQKPRMLKSLT